MSTATSNAEMTNTTNSNSLKGVRILKWCLSGLVAIPFIIFGGMKLIGLEMMMERMAEINYAASATRMIGIIEVLGVIGLFLSRTRVFSLSLFVLIMAGAVGSHIGGGHALNTVFMPTLIALVSGTTILLELRERNWYLFGNGDR
jgi:hypothetical protein